MLAMRFEYQHTGIGAQELLLFFFLLADVITLVIQQTFASENKLRVINEAHKKYHRRTPLYVCYQ